MNHTAAASRFNARGRWSALNIVLMIVGFALFWPLGLAMLAWIIWGDEIAGKTAELKGQFRSFSERTQDFGARAGFSGSGFRRDTGNAAFDEYRTAELRRLDEERSKLEAMREEFESFLRDLRRVKDREEFDRFMGDFRNRTRPDGGDGA